MPARVAQNFTGVVIIAGILFPISVTSQNIRV
jgi:hypothetical protein